MGVVAKYMRRYATRQMMLSIIMLNPVCIAGATADAFTLFERLEMQLEQHPGGVLACALCRWVCCNNVANLLLQGNSQELQLN